jgi:xanthine dehydrogenase accessory factor
MLARLAQLLGAGETVAVATVIRVFGSVPREVGTKMIIHPEGRHVGTVGGGCGEAEVMRAALDVLSTGQPVIVSADLMGEVSTESAAICGGTMDVFVERLPAPEFGATEIARAAEAVENNEPLAIATIVAAPADKATLVGRKAIIKSSGEAIGELGLGEAEGALREAALLALQTRRPQLVCYDHPASAPAREPAANQNQQDGQEWGRTARSYDADRGFWCFIDPLHRAPRLVIVGAGHIAQPLVEMAKLCDFSVIVLDDRAQFANRSRFPSADEVLVGPLTDVLQSLPTDRDTYVVLITRGHQHDMECLLQIIGRDLAYVGMIGSRRRVRGVFELLEQEHGVPRQRLQQVFAPIGVDIGGTTPAEIAVSIMAEVISVLRGGKVPSLSDNWRRTAAGRDT